MAQYEAAQYEAALSQHPLAVSAVGEVAGELLERFGGERPDLVVCFASPHHVGTFEDLTGVLRSVLEPEVLIGCTAVSVIGGAHEVEDGPAIAAWAARFDDVALTSVELELVQTPDGPAVVGWPDESVDGRTLLLLADPFSFPVDGLLRRFNDDGLRLRVLGGRVRSDGAVGVLVDADVDVHTVVSQGCRPVGSPFTVTRAEGSLVYELGGRPALERLRELASGATEEERTLMQRGLHVGLVV